MPKLKTVLQSNYFYFLLLLILIVVCFINLLFINKSSVYNIDDKHVVGYVIDYKKSEDRISILLKGKEKLIVNYYHDLNIMYGDYIEINCLFLEPNNNTIPNNFNYKKYLVNKDIFYIMKASEIKIISNSKNPLYIFKNFIVNRIYNIDKSGYILAFIIGDKSNMNFYNNFQSIGISHLFAISGMHVSLLSIIILKIFRKFKYKYIILDIFLISYGFIILFPASIKRTLIFIFIKQISNKFNINISNIKILFLTAFLLIIFQVKIIFDVSFIYSFVCVFSLFYASNKIVINNKILGVLKNSIIVALFSFPISLLFYYEYNFLSIIYNIFFIPFITIVVYPLALLTVLFPFVGLLFDFIISLMEQIVLLFKGINILRICLSLNLFEVLIYYLLLFFYLNKGRKNLLFLIIYISFIAFFYLFDNSSYIYFFDVGQGDSAFIITPYRKETILIDTGGDQNNLDYHVSNNILTFFKSKNISKISYLVLTHGDYDHMGEAINLVNNFKVEKVIFNCGPYNDLEQELIKVLDKKHIKYYSCIKELNIDNNKLYFLQTKEYDNENDNSNVIYTELNGYKFMFMGDASTTTEKEILNKYNLPDIDVLKVGHHGSKTSSGKDFINEINPKYSIISVGKNNRYGHPNREVLNNLNNSKIYRTDIDGSIMFKIKNNKLKIETCSQ